VCELPGPAVGELGPVAGRAARDERNNDKLLSALQNVPDDRRGAEYRAVLAVAAPDGMIVATAEGTCRGRIGRARRGTGGFGYDPLFVPETEIMRAQGQPDEAAQERAGGSGGRELREGGASVRPRTMAELTAEEKDAISHRGEAFRRLRAALASFAPPP
jgi:XTP/dITP diphosphohydrolase